MVRDARNPWCPGFVSTTLRSAAPSVGLPAFWSRAPVASETTSARSPQRSWHHPPWPSPPVMSLTTSRNASPASAFPTSPAGYRSASNSARLTHRVSWSDGMFTTTLLADHRHRGPVDQAGPARSERRDPAPAQVQRAAAHCGRDRDRLRISQNECTPAG
jgi:hypothetical protein